MEHTFGKLMREKKLVKLASYSSEDEQHYESKDDEIISSDEEIISDCEKSYETINECNNSNVTYIYIYIIEIS